MIKLSNGHSFEFMTASGALAFDGRGWAWEWPLRWMGLLQPKLFTIVTKTLTRLPREGNLRWLHPWSVVKKIGEDGIANAIGLTNPGIEWWVRDINPYIPASYKVIVSLEADQEDDLSEMLTLFKDKNVLGIELNLSCPNTKSKETKATDKIIKLCNKAASTIKLPLIAKLSYNHDYLTIVKELEKTKRIEAISINSVPWNTVFPDQVSPLQEYGSGGVSGKIIQPLSWKMLQELSSASSIPVIAPSIWEYEDIQKVLNLGAQAVSFGSIFVRYPWKPTQFVKRFYRETNHSEV